MQLLVENSFTGFCFVKLNWATACIFILIKSVNDDKIVANKIDGASGILQYSEVGNINLKSREYQNNTVTCWAMQFIETCSFSKLNINTNMRACDK